MFTVIAKPGSLELLDVASGKIINVEAPLTDGAEVRVLYREHGFNHVCSCAPRKW